MTLMIGSGSMIKLTLALLLFIPMLACTTTVVQSDVPCPARPALRPITTDQQLAMDSQVLEIVLVNQVALKTYAKHLEVRANCTIT